MPCAAKITFNGKLAEITMHGVLFTGFSSCMGLGLARQERKQCIV